MLPGSVKKRITVEAGSTFGWHKWAGDQGLALGIDQFGISAPYELVYDHFGLTGEKIAQKGREMLS